MSFINNVLKVFVGDKAKKDVKALQPLVDKILDFEKSSQFRALFFEELNRVKREKTRREAKGYTTSNYMMGFGAPWKQYRRGRSW